jgi:OmpA-OmpF porin, OOP family
LNPSSGVCLVARWKSKLNHFTSHYFNLGFKMKNTLKLSIALAAAVAMAGGAQAQSTTSNSTSASSGYSMYSPGSTYLGFNAGQSNYRLNNGLGGFGSDQRKTSYSLYGGGYFSEYLGAELGYTDFGRTSRAGGSTKAEGFSVSLVGRLPVAPAFNLLGKIGTTYGRTDVTINPASGITPGKESSWGMSYGIGAEYAFSSSWSGVLQYDEYRVKFAGTGREKINNTSLGVRYKF